MTSPQHMKATVENPEMKALVVKWACLLDGLPSTTLEEQYTLVVVALLCENESEQIKKEELLELRRTKAHLRVVR